VISRSNGKQVNRFLKNWNRLAISDMQRNNTRLNDSSQPLRQQIKKKKEKSNSRHNHIFNRVLY
jgi:hypothetical protein